MAAAVRQPYNTTTNCLDCFVVPPRNDAKRQYNKDTLDCFVPRSDAKRQLNN